MKFYRYDNHTVESIYGLDCLIQKAFNIDENDAFEIIHIEMMENDFIKYNQLLDRMDEEELYQDYLADMYQEILDKEYEITPPMMDLVRDIFQDSYDIYTSNKTDYVYIGAGYDFIDNVVEKFADRKTADFIEEFYEAFDYEKLAEELFYKYEEEGQLYQINNLNGENIYYSKC